MNVNNQPTPAFVANLNNSVAVARPDGAQLFTKLNVDQLARSMGEPLVFNNQSAHNPRLNKPADVKNPPLQSDQPTSEQLTNEYETAVVLGIKTKVSDQATADKLTKAFLSSKEASLDDPALADMLAQIMGEARENVNQAHKRNKNDPIPRSPEKDNKFSQNEKQDEVVAQMKKYPELYVNGQLTDKGHKMLYAIMTGNTGGDAQAESINKAANNALGFVVEADADLFHAKIGMEFENAFHAKIAHLPPDEQKLLVYLYNNDPTNALVKPYIDGATAEIQGKWGNVPIVKETFSYNFQLNAEYQLSLDQNLKLMAPQLTLEETAAIKKYLISNGQTELDPSLKSIANAANNSAMAHVQNVLGVPKSWMPDPSISLDTIMATPQAKAYLALNDFVTASQVRIDSLPNSPEKMKLNQLLKIISDALSNLKAMFFQTATADSAISADLSRTQVALAEEKAVKAKASIESQKKEREKQTEIDKKAAEDAKKQEWMGPLMIVAGVLLTIISVVATAVSFGATAGLIALAIAVVILILTLAPSGTSDKDGKSVSVMSFLMTELNKGIDAAGAAIFGEGTPGAVAFSTGLRVLIMTALVIIAVRTNFAMVAPLLVTFLTESNFVDHMVRDIAEASGGKPTPAWLEYLILGINAALVLVVIIASIKSANKAADKVANLAKGAKAADVAGDAAEAATKAGMMAKAKTALVNAGNKVSGAIDNVGANNSAARGLQYAVHGAQAAVTTLQATSQITQAINERELGLMEESLAKIVRDSAETDKKITEIDAMIKMLRKVINSLFGQIDNMNEMAKDVGSDMDKNWADLTDLMTNMNTAQ